MASFISLESGFYDAENGDRKYNAEQMSAIFDGIINDGVFEHVGEAFRVTKSEDGKSIIVGTGRAWFNSKWVRNPSKAPLPLSVADVVKDRYDAVLIEVDTTKNVRAAKLRVIEGTPADTPTYPTLTNAGGVHQYPLAYIRRIAGSDAITAGNISNVVGMSATPYVTGILKVISIESHVAQWEAQWNEWYTKSVTDGRNDEVAWEAARASAFDQWFNDIKSILSTSSTPDDMLVALAEKFAYIEQKFNTLVQNGGLDETIEDSDGAYIQGYVAANALNNVADTSNITGFRVFYDTSPASDPNNVALKSIVLSTTLEAAKWTGSEAPYLYDLTLNGVTPFSVQEVVLSPEATKTHVEAAQNANIVDGGQTVNHIYLKAWGTKPAVDIPVNVISRRDV